MQKYACCFMNIPETITQILSKYRQNTRLTDNELAMLRNWLDESETHEAFFEDLRVEEEKDIDNGSANAFDATENPVEY